MKLRQRFRLRTIGILTALTLVLGVGLPIAFGALDAGAVTCQFGDNFYYFQNDHTGNQIGPDSNGYLQDGASAILLCQTAGFSGNGLTWYEWVEKGTALCATFDQVDGDLVKMETCAGDASQYWALGGNISGEDWSYVENDFNASPAFTLYDPNADFSIEGSCYGISGCPSYSNRFAWTLNGPYR